MKNNMILKQITKVRMLFVIMLVCLIILPGCDNSTAQQKNKRLIENGKSKQENNNDLLAPGFSLADLEGNTISLDQMRGKVVLLNFWGTWCGPCRKEIPDFINLMKKHNKDGLEIIGITLTSGPPENIKAFADKWGINYKLLTDIKGNETQTMDVIVDLDTKRIATTSYNYDGENMMKKEKDNYDVNSFQKNLQMIQQQQQ